MTNVGTAQTTRRMPALDGLRGIAVLWVVLFHATNMMGHTFWPIQALLAVTHAGWFGVEIFFCLSGFLITGILLDSKHQPPVVFFGTFYWRRTLRIFPIYFGVLLLLYVVPSIVSTLQTPGWYRFVRLQPWLWLYGTNIVREMSAGPVLEFDWFELTHLWSLAVEEHFYLLWPLLVYLLPIRSLQNIATGFILLATLLHFMVLPPVLAGVMATPKHMAGLLIGACIAVWVRQSPDKARRLLERLAGPRRLLSARWLVFLGSYSYGLYLYHYIFAPLWRRVDITRWPGGYTAGMLCVTVLYVGLPLILAVVSFHLIEAPILRLKNSVVWLST
jgi:peptidoglycan/LPS O-acetylase OafA/YrhL